MSNNNGYVYIWRSLEDKGYYKKSQYVHLWIHLIFKANHEDTNFLWNKKDTILKRGQLLTGRKKLSEETGIGEGTIENILKTFENEQQILQQKTNLFRIITILNYDKLQKSYSKSNNKVTTKLQQNDTYNTLNTLKEDKETIIYTQIFDHWNSKEIIVHKKLTEKMKSKMKAALIDRTQDEIIAAISNYATVLKSDKHFFSYEWILEDFLQRGLANFLDEAKPLQRYLGVKATPKKKGVDNAEEWNDSIDKRKYPVDIE